MTNPFTSLPPGHEAIQALTSRVSLLERENQLSARRLASLSDDSQDMTCARLEAQLYLAEEALITMKGATANPIAVLALRRIAEMDENTPGAREAS